MCVIVYITYVRHALTYSHTHTHTHTHTRSDSAVIILDNLHRLIEFVPIGTQYQASHSLLHTLTTLLSTPPPASAKVLVIGTMTLNEEDELDEPLTFNLPELFSQHQFVPLLGAQSALSFVGAKNVHRWVDRKVAMVTTVVVSAVKEHCRSRVCTARLGGTVHLSLIYII